MRYVRPVSLSLAALLIGAQGCAPEQDTSPTEEAVNPSRSDALAMSPCNTDLGSFDGTTAYSNGDNTGTGYSCAGTGEHGYRYQCVELVMRHFKTHWGLRWYGNAKDLLDNAPSDTVDVYDNGDGAHPPVPGDMIVWGDGGYGHVALVTGVHPGGIDVLEQNVKGDGHATLAWDGATIGPRWGGWVPEGWAHAKANTSTVTSGDGGAGGAGATTASATATVGATTSATSGGATSSSSGGGGPTWDCADSAYNGQQLWTCSNGNLYECQSGVPIEQKCDNGCVVKPLGTNDTCKPAVQWSCASSAYNGAQYWTCSGGDLYKCQSGVPMSQECANGCDVHPLGTDDSCH